MNNIRQAYSLRLLNNGCLYIPRVLGAVSVDVEDSEGTICVTVTLLPGETRVREYVYIGRDLARQCVPEGQTTTRFIAFRNDRRSRTFRGILYQPEGAPIK